jgi:hypothetical protein
VGDTLYWFFILGTGLIGGLVAFTYDRRSMSIGFAHFLVYVPLLMAGAAVGAFYIAPALQVMVHTALGLPPAQRQWPAPVSLQGQYVLLGIAAGGLLGYFASRLLASLSSRR